MPEKELVFEEIAGHAVTAMAKRTLKKYGNANWHNPPPAVVETLNVKPTRISAEHETALNIEGDKVEVSATKGTSMRAMQRHPEAVYKSIHLRVPPGCRNPVIDCVWAELPIACLSIKAKPRKSSALSQVFAV